MGKEKPALSWENLTYKYANKRLILNKINLSVEVNQRVAVIGPNGAGKTTLFLLTCGLLTPAAGAIYLFENKIKPGKFYPDIGLVFQNPDDQLFCPTVWEDVAFGPENMGLTATEVKMRVEKALSLVGVSSLAKRIPHQLSGGEKCMVAIATILAMEPKLVLYDEPSANLDLRARRRLIDFLQQTAQTYIIATHDLELVLEVCDRVILLNQGQIIADGKPKLVMSDAQLMSNHALEVPQSLR